MPLLFSWLNISVNTQTTQTCISIKHKIYQANKDEHNRNMQNIKTQVREGEISNRKHERFISRFEHTTSLPSPLWKFFTIIDPARSLGAATPTTSSLKNSWTHKSLTCSRKNNTRKHTSLPRLLELDSYDTFVNPFHWSSISQAYTSFYMLKTSQG